MRPPRLALTLAVVLALTGCGGGGSSAGPPSTLPGDLVPAAAASAVVTVVRDGVASTVPPASVAQAVPFLVRRVFTAVEPLASYGLATPQVRVRFAMRDGSTIELAIGDAEFDGTARYVQRAGDARVWLVLEQSLAPLVGPPPGASSASSGSAVSSSSG